MYLTTLPVFLCCVIAALVSPIHLKEAWRAKVELQKVLAFFGNAPKPVQPKTGLPGNWPPPDNPASLCRLSAPYAEAPADSTGPIAPLFPDLGNLQHSVTTRSAQAQMFFNQGLRLVYGFNHHEAHRSFLEAARLDPTCAMAYWGQALALAPNINSPIDKERSQKGYQAIQRAVTLASKAKISAREKDYIAAMARRFASQAANQSQLDSAYSVAMGKLADKYPNDPDASTLYADALMNRRPWDYWTQEGLPRPGIAQAVAELEGVLKQFPNHPGAHHLYIHVVEASNDPDRAVNSADRLAALMPGAAHLVHMPAHIYLRVGRYAEASLTNQRAVEVDEAYITQCQAQGLYPMAYYPHNIHFIWAAATMEGNSRMAIAMARKTASKVDRQLTGTVPFLQGFYILPMSAYVRFGHWNEALTEPYPGKQMPHALVMWHYGRGIAYAAKGQLGRAQVELSMLDSLSQDSTLSTMYASQNATASVLSIARNIVAGEIAAKKKQYSEAIGLLQKGVQLEDGLRYDEPRSWHFPVRHNLGAVLLEANLPKEAEAVYQADLKIHRENGWALFGLQQSLQKQGRREEAAAVEQRFLKAWAGADVTLTASRF
jgi:tetratricopeptide (TPR) repeat protein